MIMHPYAFRVRTYAHVCTYRSLVCVCVSLFNHRHLSLMLFIQFSIERINNDDDEGEKKKPKQNQCVAFRYRNWKCYTGVHTYERTVLSFYKKSFGFRCCLAFFLSSSSHNAFVGQSICYNICTIAHTHTDTETHACHAPCSINSIARRQHNIYTHNIECVCLNVRIKAFMIFF